MVILQLSEVGRAQESKVENNEFRIQKKDNQGIKHSRNIYRRFAIKLEVGI